MGNVIDLYLHPQSGDQSLNVTDLFMHPQSGDIQSMSDWLEDSKDWEGDIPAQLATLLPVDDQYQN
jgi:hypothetical protein